MNYLTKFKPFLMIFGLIFILFLLGSCSEKIPAVEIPSDNEKLPEDISKSSKDGVSSLFSSAYQVNKYFAVNYFAGLNGVVGDGTADDTKAIQATLDKASANGGGVVYLTRGIYRITSPITIPENVTLKGDFISPTENVPPITELFCL
jgi:polygalacturonase